MLYLSLLGFTKCGLRFRSRFIFLKKNIENVEDSVYTVTVQAKEIDGARNIGVISCTFVSSGLLAGVLGFATGSSF